MALGGLLTMINPVGNVHAQSALDASQRQAIPIGDAPTLGPGTAAVTLVEFSDFYCPYCRRANGTLNTLHQVYGDKLRIVYRHSLLDTDNASLAALATLIAADRGHFWQLHDRLFSGPAPTSVDDMVAVASEVGLEPIGFRFALESGAYKDALIRELSLAKSLGINGVPVFFINGRPISGAQPLSVFARLIEEEISIAADLVDAGVEPTELYATFIHGDHPVLAKRPVLSNEQLFSRGLDNTHVYPVGLGRPANRIGGKEPLVTLVEFSDFDCGYCARAHPILQKVVATYGDDIALVYRHYPLSTGSRLVLEAAEAAGSQGAFWAYAARLFSDKAPHQTLAPLLVHARALHLDIDQFRRELTSHTHRRVVLADAVEAARFGVHATPTLFINGRAIVGLPPASILFALIDEEITTAKALLANGTKRRDLFDVLSHRERLGVRRP